MDFACLILFLLLYIFRPQEWWGALDSFHPIQVLSIFAVIALVRREQGFKFSNLFKTAHDWLIFAFLALAVITSATPVATFGNVMPLVLFYIVGVEALSSIERLKSFISWWSLSLMLISLLALGSEFGFDFFDTYALTHGPMKERLCLNLSIYNNPNGLGHTLVPVIPMVYFLYFWKKVVGKMTLFILAIPLFCIFLTQSKGAFICAFVTICSTLTFGRPKIVQIAILSLAGIFGTTALYALPRMHELDAAKSDEAIGGRVAAFRFGHECMQKSLFGIGLGNFGAEFYRKGPLERVHVKRGSHWVWERRHYRKAPHSSYNQTGAELGYFGFMLFIGILYSSLRTLIAVTTEDEDQERVRRALFCIVISYITSSWRVDFGFRVTFFLFVAATGALHRILIAQTPQEQAEENPRPIWLQQPALATARVGEALPCAVLEAADDASHGALSQEAAGGVGSISWNRLGWVDWVLILLLTQVAIQIWIYSYKNL